MCCAWSWPAPSPPSWFLARHVKSLLYGVAPNDWLTVLGVASLLAAVVAGACVAPLRRAFRTSPMVVLREE